MNLVVNASQDTEGATVCRVVMSDITKRKSEEEELQLSRERLEESQRIAKIGNWEADLSTGELYWSDVIYDIFGFDSNVFKPSVKAFYKAVHPDDIGLVFESEKRSEQTGVHDVIHRIVRTNGEVRFVHEIAKRYTDDKGKLIMMRGTVQDITERKIVEEALRSSERRFRETLENVQLIALELDLEGRVIFCNDFLSRLTDWPTVEIVGQDWFNQFLPQDERESLRTIHKENIRTGTRFTHYENSIQTRNGDPRFIRWSINPANNYSTLK